MWYVRRSPGGTILVVDVRVKTFAAQAAARLIYLGREFGFVGPEIDDHGGSYPVMLSLRYHRPSTVVEVSLVLAYGGEEYVTTTLVVQQNGSPQRSEIGTDTAHTGYQMRRALDRQAHALRQQLEEPAS